MEPTNIGSHINDYLFNYPRSSARDITDYVKHTTCVKIAKKQINSELYRMKKKGKVWMEAQVNGPPLWLLPNQETCSHKGKRHQQKQQRILLVNLDHENKDSHDGRITYFDGDVYGFCCRDVGAQTKFPNMDVTLAEWSCSCVTDYNMFLFSYDMICNVDEHVKLEIYVLSRNKSMVNIIEEAKAAGHAAILVEDPESLPEVIHY